MAESFFAALKNELIYRTAYPTRNKARQAIAEYIKQFHCPERRHPINQRPAQESRHSAAV